MFLLVFLFMLVFSLKIPWGISGVFGGVAMM